ncbi:uncharacterized protein V6R79_017515 [Siganus canaliculatus]
MSEEIYEVPQLTKKSDNTDFRNGHNDESIYVNCRPTKFIEPKPEDQATEQYLRRRNLERAAVAVFVVLLCLGLLAAVIVLGIENKERNQRRSNVDKLISERDELQTNYSKFRIINHNLTEALKDEQEFLKTMNRNLTTERDELKAHIESTRCPSSWTKFDNSCYLISKTFKNWNDSRDTCKDHGADLVIISNFMEQAFITSLRQQVWIGLTDREKEDTWKWVNGEAVTTTYWNKGEPNNAGGEDCVLIQNTFPKIINWNDFPSIEKKEANQLRSDVDKLISERDELQTSYSEVTNLSHDLKQKTNFLKDENEFLEHYNRNLTNEIDGLKTQMESTRCPSNWINFENSCYFISTTSKSWSDGRNMCKDHGADLVIISNIMEQKFISSLNVQVWIGLTVEKTENSLKWVDGEAATTTYWREGEPNNLGLNENCVEMTSIVPINNWNDLACHYSLKFICEKVLP